MSHYRRNYVAGGTFFFTVVAYQRRRLFTDPVARKCLREAFREVRSKLPFGMPAIVLLPDHLHCLWTLPEGDADYSRRWRQIKERFTRLYWRAGGQEWHQSESRRRQQMRGFWEKRFWEHTCRDEEDCARCEDYIHWNPCKHGLVNRVRDWKWSSFHRLVQASIYPESWGDGGIPEAVQRLQLPECE